jgi:YggT family protein
MLALAVTRDDIASYVNTLFWVYILIIFVYILLNMMFQLGLRPPYSRALNAFLGFLRDVSEPYLRLFRRIIPSAGMFDFSPIVAILVLYLLQRIITGAIAS